MIDIPALYKFTYTEDRDIRKQLPPDVSFCYEDTEDSGTSQWLINRADIDNLIYENINVDRAFVSVFGKHMEDVLLTRRVYHYKIYEYLKDSPTLKELAEDPWVYPYDVDFKTMLKVKLAKKVLPKHQGKPTSIEYYESYDSVTGVYTGIIARIDFTLSYDSVGFITKKEALLRFYRADDTFEMGKYKDIGRSYDPIYDAELRIREGVIRRRSIVDNLQLPILGVLQAVSPGVPVSEVVLMGRSFLDRYRVEFDLFIKASKKDIITKMSGATDPWLEAPFPPAGPGVTVRMYLISELSISY